jgi:hypothetical protein
MFKHKLSDETVKDFLLLIKSVLPVHNLCPKRRKYTIVFWKVVVAFVTGSIGDRLKIKNLNGLKIKLCKVGA